MAGEGTPWHITSIVIKPSHFLPKKAEYLQRLQSEAFFKCTEAYTKTPLSQTLKRTLRPFLSKLKHLILNPLKAIK